MNNKFKIILAALTFSLSPLVGCVGTTGTPTSVVATTQLTSDETAITQGSYEAIDIYLLTISDPAARIKAGSFAYQLATAIKNTVGSNGLSLADAQTYAAQLIAKSNLPDQQAAGLLLNSIVITIQGVINQNYSNLSANQQYTVVTGLVLAAANGVANATSNYSTGANATTQPVTLQTLSK
jgi:hypothetical protein